MHRVALRGREPKTPYPEEIDNVIEVGLRIIAKVVVKGNEHLIGPKRLLPLEKVLGITARVEELGIVLQACSKLHGIIPNARFTL